MHFDWYICFMYKKQLTNSDRTGSNMKATSLKEMSIWFVKNVARGLYYQWKSDLAKTWSADGSCDLIGAFWLVNMCFIYKKITTKNFWPTGSNMKATSLKEM